MADRTNKAQNNLELHKESYPSDGEDAGDNEYGDDILDVLDAVTEMLADVRLMNMAIREFGFGDGGAVNFQDVELMKHIIRAQQSLITHLLPYASDDADDVLSLPEWSTIELAGRQLDQRAKLRNKIGKEVGDE